MIVWGLFLLAIGIFLSAFFSGNETGFYRASRVRLVIDGLDGDKTSQRMLNLINNPTLFVATTLVGNNVANYLTSLAIVIVAGSLFVGQTAVVDLAAPILLSPLLFVYGELLPKNLFYDAPNRLLRFCAPMFLLFAVLFWPLSIVLWGLGRLLEKLVGQSPEKIRLSIARKEVQEVLEEGTEIGILHPTQRLLAQNFFIVASKPVREFCTPIARVDSIEMNSNTANVLRQAQRKKLPDIPVWEGNRQNLVGYLRTVELLVNDSESNFATNPRPLVKIKSNELLGEALMQMQAQHETLAKVVDNQGKTVGVLAIDQLTNPLLMGPLDSLRR